MAHYLNKNNANYERQISPLGSKLQGINDIFYIIYGKTELPILIEF